MLFIIKNGVPFDVAFSLPVSEVIAWGIIFSEIETGKKYNWNTHEFNE